MYGMKGTTSLLDLVQQDAKAKALDALKADQVIQKGIHDGLTKAAALANKKVAMQNTALALADQIHQQNPSMTYEQALQMAEQQVITQDMQQQQQMAQQMAAMKAQQAKLAEVGPLGTPGAMNPAQQAQQSQVGLAGVPAQAMNTDNDADDRSQAQQPSSDEIIAQLAKDPQVQQMAGKLGVDPRVIAVELLKRGQQQEQEPG